MCGLNESWQSKDKVPEQSPGLPLIAVFPEAAGAPLLEFLEVPRICSHFPFSLPKPELVFETAIGDTEPPGKGLSYSNKDKSVLNSGFHFQPDVHLWPPCVQNKGQ